MEKIALVTGATDGIGKATALELARRGVRVLLHGRSMERGRHTALEIAASTGGEVPEFFLADLSSRGEIFELGAEISSKYSKLDILINNAGTYELERRLTPDGSEWTFAVNYLAPFLLTRLLLPLLEESQGGRVVNVASIAHRSIASIDWGNLQGERHYDAYLAYALSKFALIAFTYTMARRTGDRQVTVNCLHPGVIDTKLLRRGFPGVRGKPPEEGARIPVYLALSDRVAGITGMYFEESETPTRSSRLTYDIEVQERLWELAETLAGTV